MYVSVWETLNGFVNFYTGSLAGAAHLLKDNAGVQKQPHLDQKSRIAEKANSDVWLIFSVQV